MAQRWQGCGRRYVIAAGGARHVKPMHACILLVFACCSAAQPADDQQLQQLAARRLQTEVSVSVDAAAEGPVPAAQVLQTNVGQQSASQQTADEQAFASLLIQKVRCKATA